MEHRSGVGIVSCVALICALQAGCADPAFDAGADGIGMTLQLAPGTTLDSVQWALTNPTTGHASSGVVSTRFSNTLAFRIGGPPSGVGYTITLTGTSTSGLITCTGTATFDVLPGTPVSVHVNLSCFASPADAGTVIVSGSTSLCAHIQSVSASPLVSSVGAPVALGVTTTTLPVPTTFAWTASAGTFDDPTSATPVFTCPSEPGPVTLSVHVAPSDAACPTTTTQTIVVECEALAPTFTNVYAQVISARCVSCHRPGGPGGTTGTLDMSTRATAYTSLVGVPAAGTGTGTSGVTCGSLSPAHVRIVPFDPESSVLYGKVRAKQQGTLPECGSAMPPSASSAPITPAQSELLRAWIAGGALND